MWYGMNPDGSTYKTHPDVVNGYAETDRRLGRAEWNDLDMQLSCVFLGLDHSYIKGSDPILFELMLFGGPVKENQDYQKRYETAEEAMADFLSALNFLTAMHGEPSTIYIKDFSND